MAECVKRMKPTYNKVILKCILGNVNYFATCDFADCKIIFREKWAKAENNCFSEK
jgi:hypothetical protein